jgi:hypothetical protein
MYNKKVLSEATANLDKAKAPVKKADIITDPMGQWKYPGQNTRIPGGNITMEGVPYPVMAQPNVGQPQIMYPGQDYQFPGADYVDEYPMARKGGSLPKLPKKKNSKGYSRSLTATNKLFAQNPLTKKNKSRKNKVFDPNAKYYQEGGALPEDYSQFTNFAQTLPSNLQDPEYQYGNPDQYNLYGMWETVGKPQSFKDVQDSDYFPLQDDGEYHGFTVGSDGEFLKPMSHSTTWKEVMNSELNTNPYFKENRLIKNEQGRLQYVPNKQKGGFHTDVNKRRQVLRDWVYGADIGMLQEPDGGYMDLELTDEEIQAYKDGGYIVEDISVPQLTRAQQGVVIRDPQEYKYRKAMYDDSLSLFNAYQFQKANYKPGYDAWLTDVGKSYTGGKEALKKAREKNLGKPLQKSYYNKADKKSFYYDKSADKNYDPLYPQEKFIVDKYKSIVKGNPNFRIGMHNSPDLWHKTINPVGSYYAGALNPIYKKPVQQVYNSDEDLDYMYEGQLQQNAPQQIPPYNQLDEAIVLPLKKPELFQTPKPEPDIQANEQRLIKRYNPNTNKWNLAEVPANSTSAKKYDEQEEWRLKNKQTRPSSHMITDEERQKYEKDKQRQLDILAQFQQGGYIDAELTPEEINWYRSQGYQIEELD